jgi:hypothetical protein
MLRDHDGGYPGGVRREIGKEELWPMLMTLTTTAEAIFHSPKQPDVRSLENNKTIPVCFFSCLQSSNTAIPT